MLTERVPYVYVENAEGFPPVADPADSLGEGLLARQAELVLEVDVARGDEDGQPPTVTMPLPKPKGKRDAVAPVLHVTGPVNISEANLDEAEIARSIAEINQAIQRAAARKA